MKHIKTFNDNKEVQKDNDLKPFRHNVENTNNEISYVKEHYPLIRTYDIRQRSDDKWGADIIETDILTGLEKKVWTGWYPEDFLGKLYLVNGVPLKPVIDHKSLDLKMCKFEYGGSLKKIGDFDGKYDGERTIIYYILYPSVIGLGQP